MYLYHFGLERLPFSLTPDTKLFCALPHHKEALNTIQFAISTGESFVKIIGEVGAGKTMLCRLLMNKIGEQRNIAYIPNPVLTPRELKLSLANELKMRVSQSVGEEALIPKIQKRLIDLSAKKKGPVILIIDEAQSMPEETLEALRLFTNLETETSKLLQIILFAQPELDEKLTKSNLRQLRQRIAFSYHLPHMSFQQTKTYITHRLAKVSRSNTVQFSYAALKLIYWASKGIPRLVNILSHKSLMLTFGKNSKKVTFSSVWQSILDTEDTRHKVKRLKAFAYTLILGGFSSAAIAWWYSP